LKIFHVAPYRRVDTKRVATVIEEMKKCCHLIQAWGHQVKMEIW